MELTRKCKICGKNIFIERDRSTFFYDKTGFYHIPIEEVLIDAD